MLNDVANLDNKEDVLRRVGDRKDSRAGQGGDSSRWDVWTQHGLRLLRVQIEVKVL